MYTFTHYGKLGDIIYSLYVVSQFEESELCITPLKCGSNFFKFMKPLLEIQPYIKVLTYQKHPPVNNINLNRWREYVVRNSTTKHIIQNHCDAVKKYYNLDISYPPSNPWIFNIDPIKLDHEYVLIQRSNRYHGNLNYNNVIFEKDISCYFIGDNSEFDKFKNIYPKINLIRKQVSHALEMTQWIKGSKYFLGNQSLGSALAQAIFHPQIQEVSNKEPNCKPLPSLIYNFGDKND